MKTIPKTKIFISTLILVIVLMVIYCLFFSKTSSDAIKTVNEIPEVTTNNTILPNLNNFETLNKQDFKTELENTDTILIDIRTAEELTKYWIISENQKHIVYWTPDFQTELNKLDKSKKYLIYCWHGARSNITKQIMKDNWFSYVKDLDWGIDEWNK